ncbi:hypothetical protein K450DRAFT_217977 [Umbelopsis ramanniana AG]|uniref:Uncharacterized protein n=1 Tax=Umbelopsis ramanniana AG TaxID=1314678 RepID=A0AAD5HJ82_UMBRA|nr:uncharacterized protein K450DRAFT_217977 [Umbelopsis ramanniana AG]KAI8584774.1 hypothetical protein K450DRAFT_217977 [Umbelopsis ramanniana AG]
MKPAQQQSMSYIQDDGPMGLATSPRSMYTENRLCLGWPNVSCVGTTRLGSEGSYAVWNMVYANITSKFTSPEGTQSSLNIQFRKYATKVQSGVNNNQAVPVGELTNIQSFLLSDSITAAEGIVVDMTSTPGVGIVQHTFPSDNQGGQWYRDVLWLEPATECVDTNLTIQFKLSDDLTTPVNNSMVLVDKGGLFDLTTTQPDAYTDTIDNIDLRHHAYAGAVWGNLAVLSALNVTRSASHYGNTYPLTPNSLNNIGSLSFMPIDFLSQMAFGNITSSSYAEPTYVKSYCQGYNPDSALSASTRMVRCSLILGAPHSADGSDINILTVDKVLEQPVYSCASTVQASIQQLDITMDKQKTGKTPYAQLQISRQSTNTSILWAIESTDMTVQADNPYWGPVEASFVNDAHLYTQQSEYLILPVGKSDFPSISAGVVSLDQPDLQGSSLPALIFTLMENLWLTQSETTVSTFDFTGKNDCGVLALWQQLSKSADTAPQIVKYIWTNLMANNAVGTGNFTQANVSPYGIGVNYSIPYAIPAFITLIYWTTFICVSIYLLLRHKVTLSEVRNAINHTAIGRVVVNMINPSADSLAQTKQWAAFEGKGMIGVVLRQSPEGEDTARFDYDPRDELLCKPLNSIPKAVPLPSPSRSQLRARNTSSFKFVPLRDTDDHDLAYYKPHDDKHNVHKPNDL